MNLAKSWSFYKDTEITIKNVRLGDQIDYRHATDLWIVAEIHEDGLVLHDKYDCENIRFWEFDRFSIRDRIMYDSRGNEVPRNDDGEIERLAST